MKLFLQRNSKGEHDTLGSFSIDGKFFCYILEPAQHDEKIKGYTRIGAGTYFVGRRFSPHIQRIVPWIMNVPGFEYILIHNGNTYKDTQGCLLAGNKIGEFGGNRAVLNSRVTCKVLEALIFPALEMGEVTITIKDEENGNMVSNLDS